MAKLIIDAEREAYSMRQIKQTMTVAELISYLEQFDDDAEVFLRHDRGYTYGSITEWAFEYLEEEDPEEE